MDAFDADVLIYAANGDPRGRGVIAALDAGSGMMGSVVLIPELLSKPLRLGNDREANGLIALLSRLELRLADREVAETATSMSVNYGLRAADAIHLATAVLWGAARFHTNNRKDFPLAISEIDVVYPSTS